MILKEFKDYISQIPENTEFEYGVSEPFSWRGSYDEVAFNIVKQPMSREAILINIELAYSGTFYGYKGGEYEYNDYTPVSFEEDRSCYTDGMYCSKWIEKLGEKIEPSPEMELVKRAFTNNSFKTASNG